MTNTVKPTRRETILDDAVRVFGRHGYRKTSVQDIADATGLSKPGLYLHFASKEDIFAAAMTKYLTNALADAQSVAAQKGTSLPDRLAAAMEAWFGLHLVTFTPETFDIIGEGNLLSGSSVENVKSAFMSILANTMQTEGFAASAAADRSHVLFLCGLSWKQPGTTPEIFRSSVKTCIRVCCDGGTASQARPK